MDESIRYWLALKTISGVGPVISGRLFGRFGSAGRIFSADPEDLASVSGVSKEIAEAISGFNKWDWPDMEMERAGKKGIKIVSREDGCYPENLRNIPAAPPLLYIKGEGSPADALALAIVGSRSASAYGKDAAALFGGRLARAGVTIVSGLARGIDTAAHEAALKSGGRTIAVLGCGIDIIYPPENARLFERIAEKGLVLSEFPMGTAPDAVNFPGRNRIISGLSLGVIVVEASLKSGSLITARYAAEQGRDVFAVPGSIASASNRGSNSLIKEGARLADTPEEVLSEILPQYRPSLTERTENKPSFDMGEREKILFGFIGEEQVHIDELVKASGMPAAEVSSLLLSLELMGAVKQQPGMNYRKTGFKD